MCRHVAWIGGRTTLSAVLLEPQWSLRRQSYEPRHQTFGRVNADGFGVGFYAAERTEPALYRNARPIWADESFASIAEVTHSTCILASVRSATPPNPVEESGCQPFMSGRWLFTHNGSLNNYPDPVRAQMLEKISPKRSSQIKGASDSEVIFALVLDLLDAGACGGQALRKMLAAVRTVTPARLNCVLTDGQSVWATESGDTLFVRRDAEGVLVASEPSDDDSSWQRIESEQLVTATATTIDVEHI